jgi:hypothetical protein
MRNIQTRRLGKLNKEDLEEFNNIFWNIFIIKDLSKKNH